MNIKWDELYDKMNPDYGIIDLKYYDYFFIKYNDGEADLFIAMDIEDENGQTGVNLFEIIIKGKRLKSIFNMGSENIATFKDKYICDQLQDFVDTVECVYINIEDEDLLENDGNEKDEEDYEFPEIDEEESTRYSDFNYLKEYNDQL